jgi:hypothetical protein
MLEILEYSGSEVSGLEILGVANPETIQFLNITSQGRPDWNGLRLQVKGSEAKYLVIDGFLRGIPNEETYYNLFPDLKNILVLPPKVENLPVGSNLSDGAKLIKSMNSKTIYLVTDKLKRPIASPDIFEKYYFDSSKVKSLEPIFVDTFPNGPLIQD